MQRKVIDKLKAIKEVGRVQGKPIYLCIRQAFEEMILSGELPNNYRLPPDRELANMIGVTHITLGKGLNELRKQRLLERSRYHGTYVRAAVKEEEFVCTDKSNLVAIIFDDVNENTFHSDLFVSLHGALQRNGYELLFLSSSGKPDNQYIQIRSILQKPNCLGCIFWSILTPRHARELMKMKPTDFPLVFMDKCYDDVMHDCVIYDNYSSAQQMGDFFLQRGSDRFIFLCRNETFKYSSIYDRYKGLRQSFIKRNLDPECVVPVTYEDISAINLTDIIEGSDNPALFAATDLDAIQVVESMKSQQLTVSEFCPMVYWSASLRSEPMLYSYPRYLFDVNSLAEQAVSIFLERLNGDRGNWKKVTSKGRLYEGNILPYVHKASLIKT